MQDKVKELLKELYVGAACGAGCYADEAITLAEEIHCELNDLDIEEFRSKREDISHLCWDGTWNDNPLDREKWRTRLYNYDKLLGLLLKGEY